ncbi:MAG: molecular chaperone DnaJ [Acetilactobacillus jinshanensis]
MDPKHYYKILGVPHDATQSQINHAYRELAKKWHPDINHSPGAGKKFTKINQAYSVLGNKKKRQQYDQFGSGDAGGGFGGAGGFNNAGGFSQGFGAGGFSDIFNDFFGGGARAHTQRRNPNAPQRGRDLQYSMTISFTDAVFGKHTTISYNRQAECQTCHGTGAKPGTKPVTCPRCHGTGYIISVANTPLGQMQSQRTCPVCHGTGQEIKDKCPTCGGTGKVSQSHEIEVDIPAGIDNGQQMRLQGQGEAGIHGGSYGDLFIVFRVKPSKNFKRHGSDIYYHKNISFAQAALGSQVNVKALDSKNKSEDGEVQLRIPAGTQTDTTFNLRNLGIPYIHSSSRGDEKVTVTVTTPRHLNKRQKEAMQAFAEASGETRTGNGGSFFDKMKDAFNK